VPPAEASGPGTSTGPPAVSVVVPTHDRRRLLVQTLRSILWQREVDFEVIVVDDGSSDGTAEVVAGLGDARVRLLRHDTPQGVAAARNRGIAEAAGAWLAFCDDDDLWAPDKLARQLQAARATGRSWVYTGEVRIDLRQRIVGGTHPPPPPEQVAARLPHWNLVPGGCSGVIASKAALAVTGWFDTRLCNLADWDLWIRLGRTGLPARVPDLLVGYRLHAGSASRATTSIIAEADMLDRRDGVAVDRGDLAHYLGVLCLRSGRHRDALRNLAAAARHGKVVAAGRGLVWIAQERLPLPLLHALRHQQGRHDRWRGEAQAWLGQLPVDGC
jgi:glycosyltransferase involved in cell wall biosynthesis